MQLASKQTTVLDEQSKQISKMGFKNVVMIMLPVVLVVVLLDFFSATCAAASSGRLGLHNLPPVHLQDHHQSKLEHVVAGGGGSNGARVPENGGGGNGGTKPNSSPNLQGGGAAVIPIYVAGAGANAHNRHHGAGSCVQSWRGSPAIAAILLAYLL